MTGHIFREYDIRGVADRDLSDDRVRRIGRALATLLPDASATGTRRIVVGRDCRLSGERLVAALSSGLVEGGAQVLDVGVGPTPLVYFGVHHLDADGGVMITGSHNPAPDNGFKMMAGRLSFFGDAIQELRRRVEADVSVAAVPGTVERVDISEAYLARVTAGLRFDPGAVRVVVDAGNGSAGPLGVAALRRAGLDPTELYCEMDGRFPNHHPDPTVLENLQELIARVKAEDATVGIAWDGDGDRLGVVDRDGSVVFGDRLLALYARDVLEREPGATVIGEVKCSHALYRDIETHGGRPIMWKTGHSLIKSKMKEEKALLAGEMSGHFFFADRYYGYDDAIYASLRLVEILARHGSTVVELLADLPGGVSTPELRVDCDDALKFDVVERVREHFRGREKLNEIDGARVTYADGAWALVRASNTGPVIVLRFEAPTVERLTEIRDAVEHVVDEARSELGA